MRIISDQRNELESYNVRKEIIDAYISTLIEAKEIAKIKYDPLTLEELLELAEITLILENIRRE